MRFNLLELLAFSYYLGFFSLMNLNLRTINELL
jgi:hypothetical protein